jgi:aldose sugar dehydrogenase
MTYRMSATVLALALLVAAGCRGNGPTLNGDVATTAALDTSRNARDAATPATPGGDHEYRVVTVAEGFVHPWSIAFLPNGDMLVTERPGRVRVVRNGQLVAEPVAGVPQVRARGQGGLLEVMAHPDFAQNQLIYLTHSRPNADGSQATTAVIRGRFDGSRLSEVQDVFEARAWSTANQHFGSKLAFDGRGHVFITVGDRGADPFTGRNHPSQSPANHQGTVVRLHDDGRVPADNPLVNEPGALPEIWSYGHRNPQGLAIHPQTGDIWTNEHGPQGGDELNLTLPGRNYGWPVVGHGVQYGGRPIHEARSLPGMEDPVHVWVPSIATSGMIIYTGDAFPNWRGNFFIGGLAGETVRRLVMDGHRVAEEHRMFEGRGRVRDIREGPDGFIYIAIDDRGGAASSVVRLEPVN